MQAPGSCSWVQNITLHKGQASWAKCRPWLSCVRTGVCCAMMVFLTPLVYPQWERAQIVILVAYFLRTQRSTHSGLWVVFFTFRHKMGAHQIAMGSSSKWHICISRKKFYKTCWEGLPQHATVLHYKQPLHIHSIKKMTTENETFNVLFYKHLRSTLPWRCEPVAYISFTGTSWCLWGNRIWGCGWAVLHLPWWQGEHLALLWCKWQSWGLFPRVERPTSRIQGFECLMCSEIFSQHDFVFLCWTRQKQLSLRCCPPNEQSIICQSYIFVSGCWPVYQVKVDFSEDQICTLAAASDKLAWPWPVSAQITQ